ncbi:glycosyltransferase [Haloarculaceae archaeon H-GB1-1]|nr:glycosyltransferase [Haloarculaceae archaeon H-GB1-1]
MTGSAGTDQSQHENRRADSDGQSLGIVVPAFQPDVDTLLTYVDALHDELQPATLRVELDDPSDDVVAALASLDADLHVSPYRRGKGAAITAGFEALETDVLAFADADGSTSPEEFSRIVAPVLDGEADLAVGSRRHPDATVASHQTLARRYLGDGFAWLARRMLDAELYDYQCGAKALSASTWEDVREHLYEPGFAWDVELVAIAGALDRTVREVPIEWHDRPGTTVSPVTTTLALARALIRARHRAKRLRESRLHLALKSRDDDTKALVHRR